MQNYSVSDVAEMLGVNVETVRRWIRDDRLKAKRGLGRGGNTLLLEDIVEFVNTPPCNYVLPLMVWLDNHGIPHEKKSVYIDPDSDHLPFKGADSNNVAGISLTSLGLAGGAGVLGTLLPAAVPLIGAAALAKASEKKRIEQSYRIRLLPQAEGEKDGKNTEENVQSELPNPSATDFKPEFESESLHTMDKSIRTKILEEQIKLVKLKQELARIQAEITVAENQIEYYNLMLKSDGEE